MRERLLTLAESRPGLRERGPAGREQHVTLDAAAAVAASVLQTGRRAIDEARRHPLLLIAGVALLLVLRPRRVFSMLVRGWSVWRLYRGASDWLQRLAATAGASSTRIR